MLAICKNGNYWCKQWCQAPLLKPDMESGQSMLEDKMKEIGDNLIKLVPKYENSTNKIHLLERNTQKKLRIKAQFWYFILCGITYCLGYFQNLILKRVGIHLGVESCKSIVLNLIKLVQADYVRCHGTKCPLLTVFFSLLYSEVVTFLPERVIVGFPNFAWGFKFIKK